MSNELKFSIITKCRVVNFIYDSSIYVLIFSLNDISILVEIVQKLQFKFSYNQNTQKLSRLIQRSKITLMIVHVFFLLENESLRPTFSVSLNRHFEKKNKVCSYSNKEQNNVQKHFYCEQTGMHSRRKKKRAHPNT